jgi:hypothetical protein
LQTVGRRINGEEKRFFIERGPGSVFGKVTFEVGEEGFGYDFDSFRFVGIKRESKKGGHNNPTRRLG